MSHGIKAEVSYIGLFGADETSEQYGCGSNERRVRVEVNDQSNSFKKHGVLSVVMLHVPRLLG